MVLVLDVKREEDQLVEECLQGADQIQELSILEVLYLVDITLNLELDIQTQEFLLLLNKQQEYQLKIQH